MANYKEWIGSLGKPRGLIYDGKLAAEFHDKGGQVFNVKHPDFGAVGDGVTDDTSAIQTAIDTAAGTGPVYLPVGRYLTTARLTLPSDTQIVGANWGSVLYFNWTFASGQGGSTYIVNDDQVNGNTHIRLHGLTIEGVYDGTPYSATPSRAGGVLFRRGSDIQVANCRLYRVMAISIAHQGISRAQFIGNQIYQCGRDGITGGPFSATPSTDIVIADNVIKEVADDGIAINAAVDTANPGTTAPSRITIVGNTIVGNTQFFANGAGRGIILFGAEDTVVAGNVISDTFSAGIWADVRASIRPRNIAIVGNVVRRAGAVGDSSQSQRGIHVVGGASVVVKDNIVDQAVEGGIFVTDNSSASTPNEDILIAGNQVTRCADGGVVTDYAIHVTCGVSAGASRVIVTGNHVAGNEGGGIRFQGATESIIEGNYVANNGSAQASATDTNAAGIIVTGQGFAPSVTVRNNRCTDTQTSATQTYGVAFQTTAGAVGDCVLEGNLLDGNQTGALIINQAPTTLVRRNNRLSTGQVVGQATLVAGVATVNTAEIVAADSVHLTRVAAGGTHGHLGLGAITSATSFVISSSSNLDTSVVLWEIVH